MKENRVFGVFAILSAIFFWIAGITHFLMPEEQLHFARGITSEFFTSLGQNAIAFHIHYWAFFIASLMAMGVFILGRQEEDSSIFKVTRIWGIAGLALIALDFARMHYEAIHIASVFSTYPEAIKTMVLSSGLNRLDPYGIVFSLVGIHVLVWNYYAIRLRTMAIWLSYLGVLGGVILQFVFIGTLFQASIMITIASGLGGILIFPIWLVFAGVESLKG